MEIPLLEENTQVKSAVVGAYCLIWRIKTCITTLVFTLYRVTQKYSTFNLWPYITKATRLTEQGNLISSKPKSYFEGYISCSH